MYSILVAEDEHIVAMDIQNILVDLGYKVNSVVDSGEEVLRRIEIDRPNLVILDISLKGKISGLECADYLSKNYDIPYIFLSGYSVNEINEKIKDLDFSGYIRKPFDKFMLSKAIKKALLNADEELVQ